MKYILFLLFISFSIFSETIILKNGQNIQGKVLGHDSESITISVDGVSKQIPKNQVHKVVFSSNNVELNKIVVEKRKQNDQKKIKSNESKPIETKINVDDEIDEEEDESKKDIYQKLIILKQNQEKYEKKILRIRLKINKLKQKLKQKKETT